MSGFIPFVSLFLLGSNAVKRKTRGPTWCVEIINLQEGQKLSVEFDEDHQAIGENASKLIWFLGQTVRSRTCCPLKVNSWKEIEQDKINHMWDIVLEKFNFDVFEGRKSAILDKMSDLYRDYRYKLKKKYFDSKAGYQLRLRNKPKLVAADEWKYLKKSTQNKTNRSKRSLPPYIGTKSYARLRYEMEQKNGKPPSRVEVFMESRKRKKGKQVDAFQQDVIVQFDQFKKQQKEGAISLNDDDIFEKVLGAEKNGYLRAYGPGKNISEYFGGRPTKVQLIKQLELTRKEANERVEEVKREACGGLIKASRSPGT
ncbi:uncharacterized protein LOC142174446 [Nicotiana tabacum]|uniref:Uncharacterized protein LOC142174446 n=1 Tax=Nicotiana tabacum TaxID=4097 RepID=A0AC58TGK9_TOBAC